jgi:nicotinamide riboside kinase
MRIAIDGVQSTGKTTLFNQLHGIVPNCVEFIPEASRSIAKAVGIASRSDWEGVVSDRARLLGFFSHLETWQAEREKSALHFVVDSSFYLHSAYRTYLGVGESEKLRSYDLILFCPAAHVPFEHDGFRFEGGRDEVEQIYRSLIVKEFNGPFIELPPGSTRIAIAQRHIVQLFETL